MDRAYCWCPFKVNKHITAQIVSIDELAASGSDVFEIQHVESVIRWCRAPVQLKLSSVVVDVWGRGR
jgi:hypothetical protein